MDTLDDVMKSALGGKSRIEQIPRVYSLRRLGSQLSAIEGGGNDTRILEILPEDIDSLFVPVFEDPSRLPSPIVKGVGVRPGAAVGVCYCNPDQAMKSMRDSPGKKIILFVNRVGVNLPFNLTGIGGLLTTSSSGKGSHEASLAEAYGFPCITGISASIQEGNGILKIGGKEVHFGEDMIAMDGGRGHIYFDENIRAGGLRTVESEVLRAAHGDDSARNSLEYHLYGILMFQLSRIISASTRNRRGAPLKVYVNASTPGQIDLALRIGEGFQGEYGKEPTSRSNLISGVGIAKTEQHFNGDDFSYVLRLMLAKDFNLSEESVGAEKKRLVDLETAIFSEMIKRVGPLPLQVRLIDVQFSECRLSEPALGKIKSDLGIGPGDVKAYLEKFGTNPLGLRGIRFGLRYPEVYQGQIEALMYSSLQALQGGSNPNVHFLIPFVNYAQQISIVRRWVDEAKTAIIGNKYPDFSPQTGSMLETPSILFGFKNLGKEIPFAHFGSGDLTQLLFGLDRGSSEQVIGFSSREYGIPFNNPFYALGAEVGFSTREVVTITARKLAKDGVQLGIGSNHMDGLDNVRAVYPYMSYISANSTNIAYVALNIAKVATNELIVRGAVGRK
ncbi:hypothetical protein HYU13_00130 [Candidatus Woesearchaeota archaeon]|nr:hypothetical protein [Candidatus Woesearchaeota archaeon]